MELTLHNGHAWGGLIFTSPKPEVVIYEGDVWEAIREATQGEPKAGWVLGVERLSASQSTVVLEGGRTNRTREAHEPFWRPVAHSPQRPPRPLVKRYLARTTPQPLPPKNVTCGSPPPWTCWKWSRPRAWSTDMADSGTPLTTTSPTSWASTCGYATPPAFEGKGKMPPGSRTSAIPVTVWRASPLTDLSPMTSVPVSPKSALGSLPRDCTQW